jgi:hypothetical protein
VRLLLDEGGLVPSQRAAFLFLQHSATTVFDTDSVAWLASPWTACAEDSKYIKNTCVVYAIKIRTTPPVVVVGGVRKSLAAAVVQALNTAQN